jgi:hypothetical protein
MDFAYTIVTSGLGATSAGSMANGIGFEVPPPNDIFNKLKLVCEEIIKMARESCERERERMGSEAVISIDGSLEHRRKAQRCFVPTKLLQSTILGYLFTN